MNCCCDVMVLREGIRGLGLSVVFGVYLGIIMLLRDDDIQ